MRSTIQIIAHATGTILQFLYVIVSVSSGTSVIYSQSDTPVTLFSVLYRFGDWQIFSCARAEYMHQAFQRLLDWFITGSWFAAGNPRSRLPRTRAARARHADQSR